MTDPLWAVLPGGIDDPAAPSGGNRYDREVLARLPSEQGIEVREILAAGSWPTPGPAGRAALTAALAGIPAGSRVLLDGLVACGVPDLLRPHARRLRLIVLVHLPLSDETGLGPATADRLRALERETLHLASVVVATSEKAAWHVRTMHDLPEVLVAEPGVELGPISAPSKGGGRLLCVASVTARKGQDVLVRALQEHLADLEWTCTFAGAIGTPVEHRHPGITFAGPLVGDALDRAYGKSDLFVLPSRAETYGMVVTEALARGLPVVATAVGGVPEALGHLPGGELPGELVPPDDPVALAAVLRRWLTEPDLREWWRAGALARRETLPSWSTTAARIATFVSEPRS